MGWFGRRSDSARALEAAAADRLERLARQWRPPAAAPDAQADQRESPTDPWQAVLSEDTGPRRIRVGPWSRPAVRALVILVSACLAVTAWWWWSGRPREVVAAPVVVATGVAIADPGGELSAPSDRTSSGSSEVVVHVAGFVARPGLVTLPAGARVADAIDAAGGVTRRRATDSVNLARVLVDGEQIVVGVSASSSSSGAATGAAPVASGPPVIDLNAADGAAFEGLPGVGPVLAGRILEWRTANGPFRSVDELGEVSGIGDATLARLRPLVRV